MRPPPPTEWRGIADLDNPVSVALSEPNCLLLDQAEWRWNEEPWNPKEELLRINSQVRARLGLTPQDGNAAQPWAETKAPRNSGRLSLRFRFASDEVVQGTKLALEQPSQWTLLLNGKAVAARGAGWWVDEAIRTVPLPALYPGKNEIVLTRDYWSNTEIEWCYLLGRFGVKLEGRQARLVSPIKSLFFGDWTHQGLPFYTGNVRYKFKFQNRWSMAALSFPKFKASTLSVRVDRGEKHALPFAPFRFVLKDLKQGRRTLEVTVFGNRNNAFGPVHNSDPQLVRIGPSAWRSQGAHWSYEYQLRPMGLLTAPQIQIPLSQ
jgi:hypothetical protein